MKVIKSDKGLETYLEIFKSLSTRQEPLVIWQVSPDTGKRNIAESKVNSYQIEMGVLNFINPIENEIQNQLPLYCYVENDQLIFKVEIKEIKDDLLHLSLPPEIKILENADITFITGQIGVHVPSHWKTKTLGNGKPSGPDYLRVKSMAQRSSRDQEFLTNEFSSMSLDEEDKLFADKRESPRARPKIDKWVKVKVDSDDKVHMLKLFDLSRGGLSFITTETNLFPKGAVIQVIGFEEFNLDDPLLGKIMSLRPLDELNIEHKIGIKFDEGQS